MVLIVLALLTGSTILRAERQPIPVPAPHVGTNASVPKIQFATPVYDFGKVLNGKVVKHDFIFTNTGEALLKIKSVHTSCGCTTAGAWSREVKPGQTGSIPIQFHGGNYSGPVTKRITVTCNDPAHRETVLQIKAKIWKPIDVAPQVAVLNLTAGASSNVTKTVRLINNLGVPVTLSAPESDNHSFTAELKTVQPGKEFQLTITAMPPFSAGNIHAFVTLKTSMTNAAVVKVPVFAIVRQAHPLLSHAPTLRTAAKHSVPVKRNPNSNGAVH